MQLMQVIALAKGINLDHQVDGQDVAEIMLALIHDEQQRLNSINPPSEIAGLESEEEEEPRMERKDTGNDVPPLPRAAVTKEGPTMAEQQLSDAADGEPRDTAPLPPPEAPKKKRCGILSSKNCR